MKQNCIHFCCISHIIRYYSFILPWKHALQVAQSPNHVCRQLHKIPDQHMCITHVYCTCIHIVTGRQIFYLTFNKLAILLSTKTWTLYKNISKSRITLPLLVTEGMLLTLVVALSFTIQLLEVEDVVDDTPVVTD